MPKDIKNKPTVWLEGWYKDPIHNILWGHARGHPRFTDGTFIHTSAIVRLDPDLGRCETLNTDYLLGNPAKEPAHGEGAR